MASCFYDPVTAPKHYLQSGDPYLAISVHERLPFNLACVSKYLWRFLDKNGAQDLEKAKWFYSRERLRWDSHSWLWRFWQRVKLRPIIDQMMLSEHVPLRCALTIQRFSQGKDERALNGIESQKTLLPA